MRCRPAVVNRTVRFTRSGGTLQKTWTWRKKLHEDREGEVLREYLGRNGRFPVAIMHCTPLQTVNSALRYHRMTVQRPIKKGLGYGCTSRRGQRTLKTMLKSEEDDRTGGCEAPCFYSHVEALDRATHPRAPIAQTRSLDLVATEVAFALNVTCRASR